MQAGFATFTDPGEFAAALNPSAVELVPLEAGQFTADVAAVDLLKTRLRRMSQSLPMLAHVQHPQDRVYFGFLADETSAPVMVDGMNVTAGAVLQFGAAPNSNQHSLGPTRWANISIERTEFNALSWDIAERDLAACGTSRLVIPDEGAMRRLRKLHAIAVAFATQTSTTPEAARGIENQLNEAVMDCLTGREQRRPTSVQVRHAAVMEEFRALLNASLDRALYLPEVCAALGVSHRTLSYCCQDFLGMAPKRYFHLRRMYMVRRALRQAERHTTTVTEIATRYGFWEFGRFAVQYRALFDETPSATLRKEGGSMEH